MSHSAGYLLPALDRPVEALVLVREPVDRVLSFYYYKRRRPDEPEGSGRKEDFFPLEQVYTATDEDRTRIKRPARLEAWEQFFNWQSRALLSVFHDVSGLAYSGEPPPDADFWRGRLRRLVEEVFFAGVQDRFEEYAGQLCGRLGWRPFVPTSKVNDARPPTAQISAELLEAIRRFNWLDLELYELCRELQLQRGAGGAV
jgi:hypothetical protein